MKASQNNLTSEIEELKQDNHRLKKNLIALSKIVKNGASNSEIGQADAIVADMKVKKALDFVKEKAVIKAE